MSNGFVYIFTNPCLEGWVKIGMTERSQINDRLKELNAPPNMPLSFRCYATYEVENPEIVEKNIHKIIDQIDGSLHARERLDNGRIREREFFKISPEKAYSIFTYIAALRNDQDKLKLSFPTEGDIEEQNIADEKKKKPNTTFSMLGINPGDEIHFIHDQSIVAKVINEKNQIEIKGEISSVSDMASKLLAKLQNKSEKVSVNGWKYFTKDGDILFDLRDRIDNENSEDA